MSNNNDNFSSKDIKVDRGFESIRMLKDRIKDGSFAEILEDWKWIFSYSVRHKWAILFYLIFGLSGTLTGQLSAYLNIDIVNIIVNRQSDRLWYLILLSVGSMLFSLTVTNYINRISTRLTIDINNDIQADIFEQIMDSDWMAISKYSNGDVLNRFNSDVGTVSNNAISWAPTIIMALVNFGITLLIMWNIDPVVAILAMCSAPFTLLASRIVIKKQREYAKKVREMSSHMMGFEVEAFYNMDTVKSFGIMDHYNKKLKWWQKHFKKMQMDYNMFTIKTNIYMSFIGYAVASACLYYCLYLLWHGKISYGEMTYILGQRAALSGSFNKIVGILPSFLSSSVSAHRVKELTDLPREVHIHSSRELDSYAEAGFSVTMDDVNYAYVENNHVIRESDFLAQPGEIVALVGPSGEGKTTMIRLILGLIRPENGHVRLESKAGGSVEMNAETRHLFSYVPQGNTILSGTVAENLRMVKEDATDQEITEALKLACAWDFIKDLPDGIHTSIGERGRGFSEGQSQRIAIARAVLRNSPILLLDEATSALDVTTERQVLRNIIQQRPNKTVIVTTHRPSVLNMCQRVYRVMDKKVTELSEEESAKMAMDF